MGLDRVYFGGFRHILFWWDQAEFTLCCRLMIERAAASADMNLSGRRDLTSHSEQVM